jgi:5-methylcytosine-specific restriction protein A
MCFEEGRIQAASVVDHIIPHKGDLVRFSSYVNTQSLCKLCHDSTKQIIEKRGYSTKIGSDGWPIDPKHPANKKK